MKKKILFAVSLFTILALVACSPKPAPGLSETDMRNTAVALALTNIVALTQSAIPTNTLVPTNTPILPPPAPATSAPTLAVLPTTALQTPAIAPAVGSNATATQDCYQPAPPPKKLLGTTVQIKLVNKSDGPVNLSLGMQEPNDKGECYTFGFSVNDKGSEVVTLLSGCYWGAGYQTGSKPSTPRVDYICFDDTTQTRGLTINNNSIGFD